MKRCLILLLCTAALLCLTGCGKSEPEKTEVITEFTEVTEPDITVPETVPETVPPEVLSENESRRLSAFRQIAEQFYYDHLAPDLTSVHNDDSFGPMEKNSFAIADVNCDGEDELLIFNETECMAGMCLWVLSYNAEQDCVSCQLTAFPSVDFYTGGLACAYAAHNQGLAGDVLWPYALYGFNPASGSYEPICFVDAWDRSFSETGYDGTKYPEESDPNGDGHVYLLRNPKNDSLQILNEEGYQEWKVSLFGSSRQIDLIRKNMTPDNIASICPDEADSRK